MNQITELPSHRSSFHDTSTQNLAVVLEGKHSIDHLGLQERPIPSPTRGEVLVRIRAVSLNYRDLDIVRDNYPIGTMALPLTPTSDAAGTVVAVGPEARLFKAGDRVTTTFWQGWVSGAVPPPEAVVLGGPGPGMLQRYITLPETSLVPTPSYLSDEAAATLPIAGLTAWESLINIGSLKAGETVLIQGTGGVAIFALQIAKAVGARVIVTSSSDEKLGRARSLGADVLINYRTQENWSKAVLEATQGEGARHVLEIGGARTFDQSLTAAARGGHVYVIGYVAGNDGSANPLGILKKKLHVHGISVGARSTFLEMNRAFSAWQLQPVVDKVFPLNEVQAAFRHLEAGKHFGKVVIQVAESPDTDE